MSSSQSSFSLASIFSDSVIPQLQIASPPRPKVPIHVATPTKHHVISPRPLEESNEETPLKTSPPASPGPSTDLSKPILGNDSATESDDDKPDQNLRLSAPMADKAAEVLTSPRQESHVQSSPSLDSPSPDSKSPALSVKPKSRSEAPASESGSSPPRPLSKKKKVACSSSEDSEEERRKRVVKLKSGGAGGRGVRQPRQRGGKRF